MCGRLQFWFMVLKFWSMARALFWIWIDQSVMAHINICQLISLWWKSSSDQYCSLAVSFFHNAIFRTYYFKKMNKLSHNGFFYTIFTLLLNWHVSPNFLGHHLGLHRVYHFTMWQTVYHIVRFFRMMNYTYHIEMINCEVE